jgi:hypothetical protein
MPINLDIKRISNLRDKDFEKLLKNSSLNHRFWTVGFLSAIISIICFQSDIFLIKVLGYFGVLSFLISFFVVNFTYFRSYYLKNEIKEWEEEIVKLRNNSKK